MHNANRADGSAASPRGIAAPALPASGRARGTGAPASGRTLDGRRSAFVIAERSTETAQLAYLRWSLVLVFLWFGGMKFTAYEASGIAPFIVNSPILHWLNIMFGIRGASDVIGVLELATAVALIAGARFAFASALGAAMSCATYVITLTFFFTTPGVAEPTAGGFPAISAPIGQFLLKDVVLLAASLCLLRASVPLGSRPSREASAMTTGPLEF